MFGVKKKSKIIIIGTKQIPEFEKLGDSVEKAINDVSKLEEDDTYLYGAFIVACVGKEKDRDALEKELDEKLKLMGLETLK